MALAVSEKLRTALKDRYLHVHKVDFDSSYPTGGEGLTAANLGFSDLAADLFVIVLPKSGYEFEYDGANAKLKVFAQGVATGATTATDSTSGALVLNQAAAESALRAMGTAVSTTYNLGPLKEAPSTADLSTLTGVTVITFGKKPT